MNAYGGRWGERRKGRFVTGRGNVNFGLEKVVQKAATLGGSGDPEQASAGARKVAHRCPFVGDNRPFLG